MSASRSDECRWINEECWVSESHADINAAVDTADRRDPWVKATDDDIPRDGSACDGATTYSEQMTLGACESKPVVSG